MAGVLLGVSSLNDASRVLEKETLIAPASRIDLTEEKSREAM